MKEVISIHIGQAGVQVGNACWELYCIEHGIELDGKIKTNELDTPCDNSFSSFFSETSKNKLVPRSISFDLDPTVIDQIRIGTFKELFHSNQLISGKEDAASNFARGYATIGKEYDDMCLNRIRLLAENCDSLQGFMVYHSIGGGTGSGFGSLLSQRIKSEYGKKQQLGVMLFPSSHIGGPIVEPINSILACSNLLDSVDSTIVMDNEALYGLCEQKLEIESPYYSDVNRIIAQFSSSLTAPLRYDGCLNSSLAEFSINLVPHPRIHFLISSLAPLIPKEQEWQNNYFSVQQMTKVAFEPSSQLAACHTNLSKFIACSMMFRGEVSPSEVLNSIATIKKKRTINFVDWCPTNFKISINSQQASYLPNDSLAKTSKSCCLISNSIAVANIFSKISHKFDLLYANRSFIHWFCNESYEEDSIIECRENFASLEKDYEEPECYILDSSIEEM